MSPVLSSVIRPSSLICAQCLEIDLSVASRHLALLRTAGVLKATKTGRTVVHEIQFDAIIEALRAISDTLERARDGFTSAASHPSSAARTTQETP
ncbi:ArsR/SmtB family transcription factor [Streptosporangium sp. DT93]|uniref:ArsR/SmtB family transcription factor n=1 Tax=Streptosporangium sp. DT93 TaxID=3393428 RepID=UPI003CEE2B35